MRLLLLVGFGLMAQCARSQVEKGKHDLNGRVKSVIQCQYPVLRDGRIDSQNTLIYVFRYQENGSQYEDDDYMGGSLYGDHGRLGHKRLYKYDEGGRQTEVEEYTGDGKLAQRVVYNYDEKGNRIERLNYSAKGELWHRSVFGFDDRGKKTECSKFDARGLLREHYTYSYNAQGYLSMEQHMVVTRTKHGENDVQAFDATNAERMMDYVKTFTYDDSGKLIGQMDNMSNFRFPFEVVYEYDKYDVMGNWCQQVRIENKKRVSILDRVIEYY